MLQKIDEESFDAFLTPIEGVPLLKLISAKSVECDAKRLKVIVTVGKDGHEDHITTTVPVGERGRDRSKPVVAILFFHDRFDACTSGAHSDKRVVDHIVSEAFMFATCGTINLVGCKDPIAELSLAMKAWKTLLYSSHVMCQTHWHRRSLLFGRLLFQMFSMRCSRFRIGVSECVAKLLGEAALSEDNAELNRFMVANPTKNFCASSRLYVNSMSMFRQSHESLRR